MAELMGGIVGGLRALEELTTQINAAVDQINASIEDVNHGRDVFTKFSGAVFVEAGLREVQRACRDFDARLEKLRSERDEA